MDNIEKLLVKEFEKKGVNFDNVNSDYVDDDFSEVLDCVVNLVKNLTIQRVSQQRELLIAFLMDLGDCYGMDNKEKAEICVDEYLIN